MSASNRTTSAIQKFTALGIASATCVGLVGLVAMRKAMDADGASVSAAEPVTTKALTPKQLDANAALLLAERRQLADYRRQLADAALPTASAAPSAQTNSQSSSTTSSAKAAAKKAAARKSAAKKARAAVAAQQVPQPQPQPQVQQPQPQVQQPIQASTRGSR